MAGTDPTTEHSRGLMEWGVVSAATTATAAVVIEVELVFFFDFRLR